MSGENNKGLRATLQELATRFFGIQPDASGQSEEINIDENTPKEKLADLLSVNLRNILIANGVNPVEAVWYTNYATRGLAGSVGVHMPGDFRLAHDSQLAATDLPGVIQVDGNFICTVNQLQDMFQDYKGNVYVAGVLRLSIPMGVTKAEQVRLKKHIHTFYGMHAQNVELIEDQNVQRRTPQ